MGRERNWPAFAMAVAAAILVAPIWIADIPAMPDFPAHLAGLYLLAGGIKDPLLAHFYRVEWQFVPNLAAEIVVPALSHLIGLVPAVKVFISAAVVSWVAGAALIQRALFGRIGLAPLFAAFFAYNVNLLWGFLNYDFGSGLALIAFAGWVATEDWRRAARVGAFAAILVVLYFCHLFAAALFLLMIACYEFERLLGARALFTRSALARILDIAILALPTLLAFLTLKPAAEGGLFEFNLLTTWMDRLDAAYQVRFDQPGYVLMGALSLFWIVGLVRGWFKLHPAMRTTLVVLLLCALFAPEWAFGGWGVDLRVPAILGVVAFAAVDLRVAERWQVALIVVTLATLVFAAAAVEGNWAYYDRQYAEFRAALKDSPRGTKIMTVLDGDAMGMASDQPYWHIAEFAILDRSGFSPLLFTTAGQHILRVQPQFQAIVAATAEQGSPPDVGELGDLAAGQADGDPDIPTQYPYLMLFQCHYDELVVIRSGGKPSPVPDMLRLRHRGTFFDLYDVRPDDACVK